jgi:hypothetical protein
MKIMTKNFLAHFLTVLFLFPCASLVSAQTNNRLGDWNTLSSHLNNEIAVKAENRKTVFGILSNAGSGEIKVRTSNKNNVSEAVFKREEVEKIWLAKLDSSSRKTLLGAGLGAAVGAGIGLIALSANRDEGGGAFGAAVPLYAAVGALVGGVAGFFARQKNKKERLIYQK